MLRRYDWTFICFWGGYLAFMAYVLVTLLGCTQPADDWKLLVVERHQLPAVGVYLPVTKTIYLAPGADRAVFEHELMHHYYGSMGE